MKLGFVSAIVPELSLEEVVSLAATEGFACVELMCWPRGKAERRYAGVTHVEVERIGRCGGRTHSRADGCGGSVDQRAGILPQPPDAGRGRGAGVPRALGEGYPRGATFGRRGGEYVCGPRSGPFRRGQLASLFGNMASAGKTRGVARRADRD